MAFDFEAIIVGSGFGATVTATELVKKPRDMLEYVIVHEMIHLIEAKHTKAFFQHLDRLYPHWSVVRAELNELALSAEKWVPRQSDY